MKLNFNKSQGFTLPAKLYSLVNSTLTNKTSNSASDLTAIEQAEAITLNFRDEDYSADTGGYHPVEIRLEKHTLVNGTSHWQFVYITDFSYQGFPYPELVKEIDVCFNSGQVFSLYGGWLKASTGKALLKMLIDNFISYYHIEVFTTAISIEE